MNAHHGAAAPERGFALITSLLLLFIITILALSMFRGFATQEHIAGNLREKERALHAAVSAQQYAEWWLTQGNNSALGSVACTAGTLNANASEGQICNTTMLAANVTTVPWAIQTQYLPTGLCAPPATCTSGAGGTGDPPYFAEPAFYIADVGVAGDGAGEAYQIDAYGYASAVGTVAVVESTYEVQQGVVNRGGL